MTLCPPSSSQSDPLTVADAAAVLAELGWAKNYEAAREELEAVRAGAAGRFAV